MILTVLECTSVLIHVGCTGCCGRHEKQVQQENHGMTITQLLDAEWIQYTLEDKNMNIMISNYCLGDCDDDWWWWWWRMWWWLMMMMWWWLAKRFYRQQAETLQPVYSQVLSQKYITSNPSSRSTKNARALSFTSDILSNQRPCLKFACADWLMAQI